MEIGVQFEVEWLKCASLSGLTIYRVAALHERRGGFRGREIESCHPEEK